MTTDILTGYHAIEERIRQNPAGVTLLFARNNKRNQSIKQMATSSGVKIAEITMSELDRIVGDGEHRGVAIEIPRTPPPGEILFEDFIHNFDQENALVVILDGVTDPQNYGAILRSADKFEADLVVVPSRRSARETQAVANASAGAINWVRHSTVTNLVRTIEQLKEKGFWIYGADMGGQPADKSNLTGKVALVMGAEGSGINRLVKEHCDVVVSIPARGHVDSLNVSVATGILMYEIRRQQNYFH